MDLVMIKWELHCECELVTKILFKSQLVYPVLKRGVKMFEAVEVELGDCRGGQFSNSRIPCNDGALLSVASLKYRLDEGFHRPFFYHQNIG
jgi:hypothetical protein